jgi:hypothetical protein
MRDAHCMPLGATLLNPATLLPYFAGLTDTYKKVLSPKIMFTKIGQNVSCLK